MDQKDGLAELHKIILEEQKLYSIRRDQHLQEVHNLLQTTPTARTNQSFNDMALKCSGELKSLKQTAIDVEGQVQEVSAQASTAMSSFESLRNQKVNIEKILNTLSAFTELVRVRNDLPQAIHTRNIDQCLKLAQGFSAVENLVLQEFCSKDFAFVKNLMEHDLVHFLKDEFEDALKKNDLQRINLCACLSKVLKQESENSLERVQNVHGKELRKALLALEEQMFEKVNTNYEEYIYAIQEGKGQDDEKEYDFPFLWHFVKVLEKVNEQAERFADNIISFYGQDGLNQLQFYLLEEISNPFLGGVLKKLKQFYEIDRQSKRQTQGTQQQQKFTLLMAVQQADLQVDYSSLTKLSLFNEEVATIVSQFNQFLQHISELGADKPQPNVNQNSLSLPIVQPIFNKLSINNMIVDVLQSYLAQSKKEVHLQLMQLFQKSDSLQALWSFDKGKILPLAELKEQLLGNGFHEWIEELFFIVKHTAKMAINTHNQMIASALISYISSDILAEEFYQEIVALTNRYLRKEYFSASSICLSQKYTVNNAFIILILNIVSNIPKYLKTLKSQLYSELHQSGSSSIQRNQMIVGAIEEMVEVNHRKYTSFLNEKLKSLAENLKYTVKESFEQVRSLSFSANENVIVEQEREYSKLFSQHFKQTFGNGMEQWRQQLSHENYEVLSEYLCTSIAKTLEQIVFSKQFHQMGAIILEKEIRYIINFFPQVTSLNVKPCFMKLQMICETLMLESVKDMEEFLSSSALGELSTTELKRIASLRLDLVK